MRKRILACLPMLMACMGLYMGTITVQAETQPAEAQIQITDDADILSSSEEKKLLELVEEVELLTNWDVMVLSADDVQDYSGETYAEMWFDSYTLKDDGAICFIDMENSELVIRTFGEAIPYITDERRDDILDAAYYEATDGDFCEAYEDMLDGISDAYQRGIPDGTEIYDEDTGEVISRYAKEKKITIIEVLIALVAGIAVGGITIGVIVGKYRLKWGGYVYSYRENGNVELTNKRDHFVNQVVTHRRIEKSDSGSSGGGSRSTTHVGAGGRRSGGGSRKF